MTGIVLGSGLGAFAESVENATRTPYADINGFPPSTVVGHKGELVVGSFGNRPVAVMSGRFHLYEGYTAHQVTAGIRLFADMGVKQVILTNAAGGIHPEFTPGSLVLITDHINLQGTSPIAGPNFIDMTDAYSERLRRITERIAAEQGMKLREGVYAGLCGPTYETPAEIRYLRAIGADLVGMSTVQETIAARSFGMEVLGISCVTNVAAGLSGEKLDHSDVLATGRSASTALLRLLTGVVPRAL